MTRLSDVDRALIAYFDGETVAPAPSGLLDLVVGATAPHRPRPAWSARTRQARVTLAWRSVHWEGSIQRFALLGLLVLGILGATIAVGARWVWPPAPPILGAFTPSVPAAASAATRVVRLPDGRSLLLGLWNGDVANAVAVVDPATGVFHAAGSTIATPEHTAVLPDGRILILGQGALAGPPWVSAEIYDPAKGSSVFLGPQGGATVGPIVLPDGRVVSFESGVARIYDLDDHSSASMAPPPFAGYVETSVPMAGSDVLLIQDFNDAMRTPQQPVRQSAAIFDPATLRYVPVAPLPAGRIGYAATALADGTVLITGGAAANADGSDATPSTTAWRFDPETGSFAATGPMRLARWMHRAARLADGRVLIIGGSGERVIGPMDAAMPLDPERTTEIYDPMTGSFVPGPDMSDARVGPAVGALGDGSVLVVGGDGLEPGTIQTAEWFR